MLRHVNNTETNKYWIHCYNCIRKYYPENKILIIDDNSINSHVMNIFTLGESYQNTHHYEPTRLVCGRYDMLGYLMRVISK